MSNKLDLTGLSANLSNGGLSLATGTATVTVGAAGLNNVSVKGKFVPPVTAAGGPYALNFVSPADATVALAPTNLAATSGSGASLILAQACIVVHAVNLLGTLVSFQGKIGSVDAAGAVIGAPLAFPSIPDNATPVAYSVVKAIGALVNWGVTNWNTVVVNATAAAPITPVLTAGSANNIATLPTKPLLV